MITTTRRKKRNRSKNFHYQMKLDGKNKHHIIPTSRGGKDNENNFTYIDRDKHSKYHHLFENKTPDEIINYLVDYFWKGNLGFIFEAIANREEVSHELSIS